LKTWPINSSIEEFTGFSGIPMVSRGANKVSKRFQRKVNKQIETGEGGNRRESVERRGDFF